MVIQSDVIMRSIERLNEVFRQIIVGEDTPDDGRAMAQLEDVLAETLNTRADLLLAQPPTVVDTLDPQIAAHTGRLFYTHATLAARLGREKTARRSMAFAVRALREGLDPGFAETGRLAADVLRDIVYDAGPRPSLSEAEWVELLIELFTFERERGAWAAAEDYLFEALALADDPSPIQEIGRDFYEALEAQPAHELDAGGLDRDEIAQGRRDLTQHSTDDT